MFKELVDKAFQLEARGEMNPAGYSRYSEPILWVVYIYPERGEICVQEYTGENRPRPYISTRVGQSIKPYPLADEAAYVLGIDYDKAGKHDKLAIKKHAEYMNELGELMKSNFFDDILLQEALRTIYDKLRDGSIKKAFGDKSVTGKEWITFVYEKGLLKGKYLHEIPETKHYWGEKSSADVASTARHQCAICGNEGVIIKNCPTPIKFSGGSRQMMSLNQDAFVSHRFTCKGAPLGICYSCAEKSAQTMNYLLKKNKKEIYLDKNSAGQINGDSARNLTALYWLKEDALLNVNDQEIDLMDLCQMPLAVPERMSVKTTESLIHDFLISPWTGQKATLDLDDNTFYLVILSPNGPGRMVIREWLQAGAAKIKRNLATYFKAMRLVNIHNLENHPYTVQQLLEPLGEADPNMSKNLLRTIYIGEQLPFSLFQTAVRRLRLSGARESGLDADSESNKKKRTYLPAGDVWQRLCTVIKLYLTYGKEDAEIMAELNETREDLAYQSGRLLAALEEIQRRAANGRLSSSLVERYYGSASTSPHMVFPMLVNMATKAHIPKIRKNNRGSTGLESLLEEILLKINSKGGFPKTLVLPRQGEFALGFYHQRVALKAQEKQLFKNSMKREGVHASLS